MGGSSLARFPYCSPVRRVGDRWGEPSSSAGQDTQAPNGVALLGEHRGGVDPGRRGVRVSVEILDVREVGSRKCGMPSEPPCSPGVWQHVRQDRGELGNPGFAAAQGVDGPDQPAVYRDDAALGGSSDARAFRRVVLPEPAPAEIGTLSCAPSTAAASTTAGGREPLAVSSSMVKGPAAEAADGYGRWPRRGRAAHGHPRAVGQRRVDDRAGRRVLAPRPGRIWVAARATASAVRAGAPRRAARSTMAAAGG